LSAGVRTTADGLRRLVRDVSLTTTLTAQSLTDEPGAGAAVVAGGPVAGGLDQLADALSDATSAVSRRRAGVGVVRGAAETLADAEVRQSATEREAEQSEARW